MSTTALRALIRKDLRLFLTDRRAVLMSFALPIAFASFFSFILGGTTGKDQVARIRVHIVDEDHSVLSREIVQNLSAEQSLESSQPSAEEARESVRKGKVPVGIIIPSGFGASAGRAFFGADNKPKLQLLYDPSHGPELAMARGILAQHVMQAVSKQMLNGVQGQELTEKTLAELDGETGIPSDEKRLLHDMLVGIQRWNGRSATAPVAEGSKATSAGGLTIPYELHEEAVTSRDGKQYNPFAHSFAGMGVQFVLMMAIEAGIAILLQRQRGLWKRLRAAPLSRSVLLTARVVSAALIGLMTLFALFAFGRLMFGVTIDGSVVGFLGVCLAFALMSAAFGLMVASLGKSPEATRPVAIFSTLIMVMLGGAWVPSMAFPGWPQKVTLMVPTRWAIEGLEATSWRGLGAGAAAGPVAALLGFTLLFSAISVMRFRWDVD